MYQLTPLNYRGAEATDQNPPTNSVPVSPFQVLPTATYSFDVCLILDTIWFSVCLFFVCPENSKLDLALWCSSMISSKQFNFGVSSEFFIHLEAGLPDLNVRPKFANRIYSEEKNSHFNL